MKRLIALGLLGSLVAPQAALAGRQLGHYEEICYVESYEEVYVPGNRYRHGYVETQIVVTEVPCRQRPTHYVEPQYEEPNVDDNSCIEGAVLGGILGGGAAALGSRGDGYAWSVPLGIVGGSLIGCQIDGG